METELREPSGERLEKQNKNDVRDGIVPSPTQSLEKYLILVQRKMQLNERTGEGGKRHSENSRSLRKQQSLQVVCVEEGRGGGCSAIFIPSLSLEVVCVHVMAFLLQVFQTTILGW